MRSRSPVLSCLLLAAVLATALPAAGQTTLFSDDFGPKPLASWTSSPLGLANNWNASSGAAVYNGGGHTQLYAGGFAGNTAWTDYRVEAKVQVTNPSDFPGGIRGPGQHGDRPVLRRLDLPRDQPHQALPRRRLEYRHHGPGPAARRARDDRHRRDSTPSPWTSRGARSR